jgi:hypothetical protein
MEVMESRAVQQKSESLQKEIRAELARCRVTKEQLAQKLGLLPIGAEVLLARSDWSIETALKVAEAVGLEVEFKVRPSR